NFCGCSERLCSAQFVCILQVCVRYCSGVSGVGLTAPSIKCLCSRRVGLDSARTPVFSMMNNFIAPPHLITGRPTVVEIGIYVNTFDSVNVESMDYSIQIFLRLSWIDRRLSYNVTDMRGHGVPQPLPQFQTAQPPTALNDTTGLTIDPRLIDEIWLPDIIFMNEKQAKYHDITIPNKLLRIKPNGEVYYSSRISLRLGCHMGLYRFPLDTQTCEIIMESYRFTRQELRLRWRPEKPFEINKNFHLPQFVLTNWSTTSCDTEYISGEYPCLRVQFVLRRVFAVYLIQYYVPSTLIVILSWVSFWISIEAVPARISLGVMTVLSMTTQSMGLWMTLPKASYIKAIDIWMGVTVMYVFGAMVEFAMVNTMARNEIRRVTTRVRRAAAAAKTNNGSGNPDGDEVGADGGTAFTPMMAKKLVNEYTYGDWKAWAPNSRQLARKVDKGSRILFPLSFAVFFVCYWGHFILF
uniref:Neur_chan_LBD domain-containing protein n=2 Tax=Macrostomum lignano TaxID=282301 RepID=A0A1I8HWS8_9PLAT